MSTTRQILRAFIASPGDLSDERRAIRNVVSEFNDSWADELGYQIQLLGWEDTVAGLGRPQHIINEEVDRCDLFLGMMWKRWGTPPDNEGRYTSGFHEEFSRSVTRSRETGSPEISLFFKTISDDLKADPGEDLKKVLQFRDDIIAKKTLLFQEFTTTQDMERLARKCITQFVNQIRRKEELSKSAEIETKNLSSNSTTDSKNDSQRTPSSLDDGLVFLKDTIDSINQTHSIDQLTSLDVARLRLLANSFSKPGNHEMELGAHDINIIFSHCTQGLKLSQRETRCLLRLGFRYLNNENVPLWCWYRNIRQADLDPAFLSSVFGSNNNEKIGAISILISLARALPVNDKPINRDWILDSWFSDQSSSEVRLAALGYLAAHGSRNDYPVVEAEYNRNDHTTYLRALESMVEISIRTAKGTQAQALVLNSQFEALNSHTLQRVLEKFDELSTEEIRIGLDHRNAQVRRQALRTLLGRHDLAYEDIRRMTEDSDPHVRNEAVLALQSTNRPLTPEEIKKILTRPSQRRTGGLLGAFSYQGSDKEGEKLYDTYEMNSLRACTNAELTRKVDASHVYDDKQYFVRAETYFSRHGDLLRSDIDDTFASYFDERIARMEKSFGHTQGGMDVVQKTKELGDFIRKGLTRKGLDVLCRKGSRSDVCRVRTNLQTGFSGTSMEDVKFIAKCGCIDDVDILVNIESPNYGGGLSAILPYGEFQDEVAKALLKITRPVSIEDLFSYTMPEAILKRTVSLCPEARFSRISNDAINVLLHNDSADVRRAASIMVVRTLSKARIRKILQEYISGDTIWYYNVVHWLDLGVSMSRRDARRVARLPVW